jgi:uncharacterized protein (DUF2336 family)
MLKAIKKMLERKDRLPKDLSYDEAVKLLETHSNHVRSELAEREDTQPEILYYLSNDVSTDVRAKVAGNMATPGQALSHLAEDEDDNVRCELAQKIGRLLGLSEGEATKIREFAIEALEKLAADQAPRVRQIIAEEIKEADDIPLGVVRKLAHDLEVTVAGPILEFSPLLSDDDLLEVIASGRVHGALEYIAKRADVSGDVSDAVVATLDVPAVSALLNNENAQIREDTLDFIIDNAKSVEDWHEPIVMRSELSLRATRRIAGFVAFSLLAELSARSGLDAETQAFLKKKVRARIETEETLDGDLAESDDLPKNIVRKLKKEKTLDAGFVADAVEAGNRLLVVEALSSLSDIPAEIVSEIIRSKDGKPITAVVWKAGLPMRIALDIQRLIASVPPPDMVMAKDGVDFSMTEDEMTLQISFHVRSKKHA